MARPEYWHCPKIDPRNASMILSSARFPHDSPPLTPPTPPSQNNQPLPEPSSPLLQQVGEPVGIVSTMDGWCRVRMLLCTAVLGLVSCRIGVVAATPLLFTYYVQSLYTCPGFFLLLYPAVASLRPGVHCSSICNHCVAMPAVFDTFGPRTAVLIWSCAYWDV